MSSASLDDVLLPFVTVGVDLVSRPPLLVDDRAAAVEPADDAYGETVDVSPQAPLKFYRGETGAVAGGAVGYHQGAFGELKRPVRELRWRQEDRAAKMADIELRPFTSVHQHGRPLLPEPAFQLRDGDPTGSRLAVEAFGEPAKFSLKFFLAGGAFPAASTKQKGDHYRADNSASRISLGGGHQEARLTPGSWRFRNYQQPRCRRRGRGWPELRRQGRDSSG